MNKQCTGCVVSAGTHKPAEALHQEIAEPQADAMRGNTAGGVRCHDADACAMGQLPCPTPGACGCAPAPQAVQAAVPDGWVPCVITYEGQHPEEIAYGPQAMMDRLKKWLDRYFEMRTATAHPAEGVPEGFALVPLKMTRAMDEVLQQEGWTWQDLLAAAESITEQQYTALAATQPAAQGMPDSGTPGPWSVRKRFGNDGEVLDCFVTAPDCQGLAYAAEILGDDEYRDGIERKLADCELIATAVNAHRAALAAQAKQGGK